MVVVVTRAYAEATAREARKAKNRVLAQLVVANSGDKKAAKKQLKRAFNARTSRFEQENPDLLRSVSKKKVRKRSA